MQRPHPHYSGPVMSCGSLADHRLSARPKERPEKEEVRGAGEDSGCRLRDETPGMG